MFRAIIIACITVAAAFGPASATNFETNFLIKRNGKSIGYHRVIAAPSGDGLLVRTDIAMKVKFGPVTLFRYAHDAEEFWRDDDLEKAAAETDRNGRETFFRATREGGRLTVESSAFEGALTPDVRTTSWWNRQVLTADRLASTQTGEVIDVTVENLGLSPAPGGLPAEHYRIAGGVDFDIWYDGERWVGARFVIDGEELIYERVTSPTQYAELEAFLP